MRYKVLFLLIFAGIMISSCNRQGGDQKTDETGQELTVSDIDELTALIREDSSDALLFEKRAQAYLAQRDHNLAMRDMLQAIQLDPDNARYMLTLSDIYMSMGLLDNCIESLDRALRLEPENVESMLKLSEINFILKKYKEALEYADMAIAVEKINPLPYFMKGYIFAEAGDTIGAITNYLEAIDKDQAYYDAFIQLGLIYSTAGNTLAIDYFNNALNVEPQSTEALYALAMFYQEAGDAENAIAAYSRLLVVDPENVYGHYNLGYVNLVMVGDFEQAVAYFERAEQLKPDYFEAIYNKGYCYELLGDLQAARDAYNAVLEIEVNYEKAIVGLNRIYGH